MSLNQSEPLSVAIKFSAYLLFSSKNILNVQTILKYHRFSQMLSMFSILDSLLSMLSSVATILCRDITSSNKINSITPRIKCPAHWKFNIQGVPKKWWQDSMTKTIHIISIKGSKMPRKILPPFILGHPVYFIIANRTKWNLDWLLSNT